VTANYDIPMSGAVRVVWNIGVDEDGLVEGFIGVPLEDGNSLGTTLEWKGNRIERFSDEDMREVILIAVKYALQEYVRPILVAPVVGAAIEMRDRLGGYDASLADAPYDQEADDA
jgi:hypothetical protein